MANLDGGKAKSFYTNTGALFVMQIVNYIFPFILIPYLTRILGTRLYGLTAFALAMAQIACVITDYGFNLSATYSVSKERDNKDYLNHLLGTIYFCKFILLLVVVLVFGTYITLQTKYLDFKPFLYFMFIFIIGQTFQPIWFFQGIEKMINITIYTLFARVFYLLVVIFAVKGPEDYLIVSIANGSSQIISALIGTAIVLKLGYRFRWRSFRFALETFRNSTSFFWSRAAVATYTTFGTFFLGIASSPVQVAYYSSAETLYRGAQALFGPVSQALYPHMAKHKNFPLFFKILKICVLASIVGGIIGVIVGPWFITKIFGVGFEQAYPILIVFILVFNISVPSILLGYSFLGAIGNANLVNKSVIFAGVIQLFILSIFYIFNLKSAIIVSFSVLIVELVILILRIIWAKKSYKNLILVQDVDQKNP